MSPDGVLKISLETSFGRYKLVSAQSVEFLEMSRGLFD